MAHRFKYPGGPAFFSLWLVMWSNPNSKTPKSKNSAESKKKSTVFSRKQRISWSCYPELNWGPHPYQLIASPRSATFRCFWDLFVSGNRRQWCFPLHCLRPLVSYCGSTCGSGATHWPAGDIIYSPPHRAQKRKPSRSGRIDIDSLL